jgi:hypothetical protein
MISMVLHLYYQREGDAGSLIGTIEPLENEDRLAFHNKDELWQILQALAKEALLQSDL